MAEANVIILDPDLEGSTETDPAPEDERSQYEPVVTEEMAPSQSDTTDGDPNGTNVAMAINNESLEIAATQDQQQVDNQAAVDAKLSEAESPKKEPLTRTESNLSQVTVTSGDSSELTPLIAAIDEFDTKAVEAVIKAGANVKDTDDAERNSAHFLIITYCKLHPLDKIEVKQRLIDILHLLVQNGVNVNAEEKKKQAPLHIAASYPGNAHIIKPLLASGGMVNLQDGQQRTALHYAVAKGDEENARALIEGGANPNIQDNNKQTPLHLAVKGKRRLPLVQFLLSCGAEANISDRAQKTPLHIAAKAGRPELIRELLNYGASVNHRDSSGQTAIHLAAVSDITGKSLRELLNKPAADVNIQDDIRGDTALHKAVALNMQDNIQILAKARADPNIQDILGETPLHKAFNVKEFNIWKHLMMLQGDVQIRNEGGHSVYTKALKAKNDVALAVMRQCGVVEEHRL